MKGRGKPGRRSRAHNAFGAGAQRPPEGGGGEDQEGGELRWIAGTHAVEETLKAKPHSVRDLWVEHQSKNPSLGDIIRRARNAGVRVQYKSRGELDRAAGERHQGVAVRVLEGTGAGFVEYLEALTDEDKKGLVLVALDQIQDPHNLGAIARSAVNLGARALLLPERRTSPVSSAAVQASAGAIQKLEVLRVGNLAQALERCREAGFWIYGADASGGTAWKTVLNTPLVLVIGSEGYGMRPLVKSLCDELVSVPQSVEGVASLNASCAASVLLYEIARQKAASGGG